MGRLWVVGTCLVALSCGGTPAKDPETPVAPPASASPSPAELQKKTMADYEAAWVARDAQKAASAYTDDAVVRIAGAPEVSGREAIQAMLTGMFAGSADAKTPFTRQFHAGNTMVGEWVWAGTHSGELMGIPATGKPFGLMGVSVYQFTSDGLLEDVRVYFDAGTLLAQLGVSPQPARPIQALPTAAPMETTAAGGDSEQRNIDAVKKMLGAFEAKNEADFLAALGDDVEWDDMAQPAAMRGKDAARAYFDMMTTAFPDARVTIQNVWGAGDYVVCENSITGTQSGPLGPLPPTNKSVSLHGLDIVQFDSAGQIVKGWSYSNSFELLMQLGLIGAGDSNN